MRSKRNYSADSMETLETRRLLSAAVQGTVLNIAGTAKDDRIVASLKHDDSSMLEVHVGRHVSEFSRGGIKSIRIEGRRGDDSITIDQSNGAIKIGALVLGGSGDDSITGGSGKDRLHGESGDDRINGDRGR